MLIRCNLYEQTPHLINVYSANQAHERQMREVHYLQVSPTQVKAAAPTLFHVTQVHWSHETIPVVMRSQQPLHIGPCECDAALLVTEWVIASLDVWRHSPPLSQE